MSAIDDATVLWGTCIGIGVVVALCVVVLLSLLSAFVGDIDRHVSVVAAQLQRVADNTGASPHVHETARLISALGVEVGEHVKTLSRRTGPA